MFATHDPMPGLITLARAGDGVALGQALQACRPYLLTAAARSLPAALRAKADPADLVQEAFLDAHRYFAGFTGAGERELLAWLAEILRCRASNLIRGYRHAAKRRVGREVPLGDADVAAPADEAELGEEARLLEWAVARLPADQRRAFVLRHGEHRSFEEMAAILGRSPAATRKLWQRSVRSLGLLLREPRHAEGGSIESTDMADSPSVRLQHCLDRLCQGDTSARSDLLEAACDRLRALAHQMLGDYPGVRRWEETGDVCQNALIRLARALETVSPPTLLDFYRLAAAQIRRELIDLARHHYGPQGPGAHHASTPAAAPLHEPGDATHDPAVLGSWTEFHRQVELLDAEEREVFDLLFYQGLAQEEAASVLGVALRTVKRRWQSARRTLHAALGGEMPWS